MCSEIKCCAAGSTTRRNASACGAHDTQGVDASTRNSIAPVSRTERSISDSTSSPDAGASDPEDWSWSLVIAEAILIRRRAVKGNQKMQSDLDVIRGMYSAFSRGDVASVLAALAPEIVWIEAEGFPSAGTYTTPDAVLHKVFMRLARRVGGLQRGAP